jgi:hypothetical protein
MELALVYDPRGHSFESWSALMCEAYAAQQLAINIKEEKWRDWATGIMAIDVFQNNSVPDPYLFNNWRDWAENLVNVVNQQV